jgi:anti-sigma regulatory factor (Ser/Thr protein kinase)
MEWRFQDLDAITALAARHAFTAFLRENCTPESDCESAQLVFGELVANVVRHAPGPIEIVMQSDHHGAVRLEVYDRGRGFDLSPSLPAPLSEGGGRGLYLVSRLCIHLSVERIAGGTRVRAVLPVAAKTGRIHLVADAHGTGLPRERAQDEHDREVGDASS